EPQVVGFRSDVRGKNVRCCFRRTVSSVASVKRVPHLLVMSRGRVRVPSRSADYHLPTMSSWARRMTPLLLWFGFLAGYHQLYEWVGAYAPLVGLFPVAVTGWAWGAWAGLL